MLARIQQSGPLMSPRIHNQTDPNRMAKIAFFCLPGCFLLLASPILAAESPFATEVVSYDPGSGGVPGFDDPESALGPPSRTSGGVLFPSAVTPFQPAFMTDELVSLGTGGALVLGFDHPVRNDPGNPFGIDLIIFGNPFLGDTAPPFGVAGNLFGEGGEIAVSMDGVIWHPIPEVPADGAIPTMGWMDSGPYDTEPGGKPTDFTRPVDPIHSGANLMGMTHLEIVEAYNGSGGGTGIDLDWVGLSEIRYVRISNQTSIGSPEVDAVADVSPDGITGDLNGDGLVDGIDLGLLLAAWASNDPHADLDGNGVVNGADLGLMFAAWSAG